MGRNYTIRLGETQTPSQQLLTSTVGPLAHLGANKFIAKVSEQIMFTKVKSINSG